MQELHATTIGRREREALAGVEREPGLIVAQLADRLGISDDKAWQIVKHWSAVGWVRRD